MLCLFILLLIINTKQNLPKTYKVYHQKYRFSIILWFQNANENEFLKFGYLALDKFLTRFRNLIKEFV